MKLNAAHGVPSCSDQEFWTNSNLLSQVCIVSPCCAMNALAHLNREFLIEIGENDPSD